MIRKYNQIDHYVELVCPSVVILSKQDEQRPADHRVDRAPLVSLFRRLMSGKSYLSFVMNYCYGDQVVQ